MTSNLITLLTKLQPISLHELKGCSFSLFGSGGFAKNIFAKYAPNIKQMIEYKGNISSASREIPHGNWCSPEQATGVVVLGTGNGNYQYNQLKQLALKNADQIDKIYLIDPYLHLRNLENPRPSQTILLLEHADGVVRHHQHLANFKKYMQSKNMDVVSLCPLTLHFYTEYLNCKDLLLFNGQRELYQIVEQIYPSKDKSYVEYGFFPQKDFYYLDRKGVNQKCTLMYDSLDWIDQKHIETLGLTKAKYLKGFSHQSREHILVPLQVPDDVNVLTCSRFGNGMQEFIDYIVSQYSANDSIIFKPHPKDPQKSTYNYHGRKCSDKPFLQLLEHADVVHGINSSTLYEAGLAGVEVILEGESLLRQHEHQKDKLFAAMINRQKNISSLDLDSWVEKNSHIKGICC